MLTLIPILKSVVPRRQDIWIYLLTFIPCAALLFIAGFQSAVPIEYLTKDPLVVAKLTEGDCCAVYFGLFSNIGILLWCGTAAICLFSALLTLSQNGCWKGASPLIAAGLFTTWLMLDDMFLVHEKLLPELGVAEQVTYVFYACLAIMYFVAAWRTIIKHRASLLLISLFFLGTSVVIDSILHSESDLHVLVEDGAKILGIAAWAAFHVDMAFGSLGPSSFRVKGNGRAFPR